LVRLAISIGHSPRSEAKPECISAAAHLAKALAAGSAGHRFAAGNRSARYSQMASVSQIASGPSFSTGTNPLGEPAAMISSWDEVSRSLIMVSLNGAPVRFNASHGRIDQLEMFLSPIRMSMHLSPLLRRR